METIPEGARANFLKWTQKVLGGAKCAWFEQLKADFDTLQQGAGAGAAAGSGAAAGAGAVAAGAGAAAAASAGAEQKPLPAGSEPAATGAGPEQKPPPEKEAALKVGDHVILHATKNKAQTQRLLFAT